MPAAAAASIARCRIAAAHDRVDQRPCGPRQRRGDLRCLAGRSRQEHKPVAHELVQARRDRDIVVGVGEIGALLHRPADLERKERVSARSIVNADERSLGQARIQASDQQTVQLCRPERPDRKWPKRPSTKARSRSRGNVDEPSNRRVIEQADPLVSQAASHERKHALRLWIEPLDIVDPDDGRAFARDRAEYPQRSQCHRPLQRLPLGLPPQQRHLERPPLRLGKLSHRLFGTSASRSPSAAYASCASDSIGRQTKHAVRPIHGRRQSRLPEHGLPDPELTLQHERDRTSFDPAQELAEVPQLLRATDDRLRLCKHREISSRGDPIVYRPGSEVSDEVARPGEIRPVIGEFHLFQARRRSRKRRSARFGVVHRLARTSVESRCSLPAEVNALESRALGTSGVLVSDVGLGGFELGPEAGEPADLDRAVKVVEASLAAGINWLDTSENYLETRNESLIGAALERVDGEFQVATKAAPGAAVTGGGSGFRPEQIHAACRASLVRLGREQIDVYFLHWPDDTGVPLEETGVRWPSSWTRASFARSGCRITSSRTSSVVMRSDPSTPSRPGCR